MGDPSGGHWGPNGLAVLVFTCQVWLYSCSAHWHAGDAAAALGGWVGSLQHHEQKGLFMKPAGGLHPGGVGTSQGSCAGMAECG